MCAASCVLLPPVNTFSVSLLEYLAPWEGAVTWHQVKFTLNEKMELFHAFIRILVINSDLVRSPPSFTGANLMFELPTDGNLIESEEANAARRHRRL